MIHQGAVVHLNIIDLFEIGFALERRATSFLLAQKKKLPRKKGTLMSCPTDALSVVLFQRHAHTDSSTLSPDSFYLLHPCSRVLMRSRHIHVAQPMK